MTKLAGRLLCLIIGVAGACLVIVLWPLQSGNLYLSVADKHDRLEACGSPKIIFVGGSSLALGLDSELIETALGWPITNMGVNGGFGLRYMLDEIKPALRAGDIVVLSPEYEHWYGTLLEGGLNMVWAIRAHPASLWYLSSPRQFLTLAANAPEFLQGKFLEMLPGRRDPIYNRAAFNRYGDFVNHLPLEPAPQIGGLERIDAQAFNPETAAALQSFAIFAEQHGAQAVYSFPPLAESQYRFADNRAAIDRIVQALNDLPRLSVLDRPADHVYPDELFFDTVYHLRGAGRALRSRQVAAALLAFLTTEVDPR